MVKNWKQFPKSQKQDKGAHSHHYHFLEVLPMAIREEKEIKGTQIRKEVKLSPFADNNDTWSPKDTIRNLLELISEFTNIAG